MSTWFDAVDADGIRALVAAGREEDLALEFSTASADFNADARRKLARCASAFANSSGGIIVWGIDARRNERGVDGAIGIQEICPLALFRSRLEELSGSAVSPIPEGIRHRTIPLSHADAGVALTLVPESDAGPHMAAFSEDRYFKRSGARSYHMMHFDIADMFGRRRRPKLIVECRAHHPPYKLVVSIVNTGRGPAFAPYLVLTVPGPYSAQGAPFGLPRLTYDEANDQEPQFGGSALTVIHPHQRLDVARLECPPTAVPRGQPLMIGYTVAADGFPMTAGTLLVDVSN